MNVLHVYRTYFPDSQGGLEESIRQICCNTKSLGTENRILTLSRNADPAVLIRPEAQVHRFPLTWEVSSNGLSIKAFFKYRELTEWADVVHYHFPWPFADMLHLYHKPRSATVLTYHSDIIRQRMLSTFYRPVMTRFLQKMDRVVATSPAYAATSPVLNRLSQKTRVIPFGLDPTSYPSETVDGLKWARGGGEPFFLFIGVLRYYKGLHILLDAVAGSELYLVIAGSGPMDHLLRQEVSRRGAENIRFLGQVSDQEKVALIKSCTALVLPSHLRSEAFGISLLEGAMHGRPLISTEIGTGTSYVNEHLKTGIVVPSGDARMLREAMEYLARHPQAAEEMGVAAHERYQRLFTGKKMGEAYYSLYREISDIGRMRDG